MSLEVSKRVWWLSHSKGGARLLLLAIAEHAHDDGTGAYPGVARLMKMTKLSHGSVFNHLKTLVALGELEIVEPGGGRLTSLYRVTLSGDPSNSRTSPRSGRVDVGRVPPQNVDGSGTGPRTGAPPKRGHKPSLTVLESSLKSHDLFEEAATTWCEARARCGGTAFADELALRWLRKGVTAALKLEGVEARDVVPALTAHAVDEWPDPRRATEWIQDHAAERNAREAADRARREREALEREHDAAVEREHAELRATYPGKSMRQIVELAPGWHSLNDAAQRVREDAERRVSA